MCLTEETEKAGEGWGGWWAGAEGAALEDSNREDGLGGAGQSFTHLKTPASKLTLMASRQVGTKGHFWRL